MVAFEDLAKQNPWWESANSIDNDPKIRDFEAAEYKWEPRLRKYVDLNEDVLYSVRGPRQVGKTTFVKLLIRDELKKRKSCNVFYYACDLVAGGQELKEVLDAFLDWSWRQSGERKLVFLDEVSRVKDWELAYKQVVDARSLKGTTYVLTGSSAWDLKHGVERLGGRKGEATGKQNHKVLLPMKFAEYAVMRNPGLRDAIGKLGLDENEARTRAFAELFTQSANHWLDPLLPFKGELDALFDEYLITGGVMSAVNQYLSKGGIGNTTYELYLQLFFGDIAKLKRDENTAKKVLSSVLRHPQSSVGWQKISQETAISSPITVSQYVEVLQTLFVLNAYNAFDQNTRQPRHRSDKKLQITNPFFFHAFRGYLENPAGDYYRQATNFLASSENKASLVEFVVGDHLARLAYNHHPSDLFDQSNAVFYVKNASGETIDFIVRLPDLFLPVEVKYQNQIVPKDYKNLKKFEKGVLVSKDELSIGFSHPAIPVSLFLLFI